MDLPSFPTDNLYKFITIASVAVFCFSIWQEESLRAELNSTAMNIRSSNASTEFLQTILSNSSSLLEKHVDDNLNDSNKESIRERVKLLRSKVDALVLEHAENIKRLSKAENESEKLLRLMPTLRLARYGSLLTFFLGIFFWYYNHQRFQDAAARKEAQRVE